MSSLPPISHRLFVAAVKKPERGRSGPLRQNRTVQNSSEEKSVPAETPVYNEKADQALAEAGGSLVMSLS
jgi:hypothetical protein